MMAPSRLYNARFVLLSLASLFFFSAFHLLSPVLPLYFGHLNFTGFEVGSLLATFSVSSVLFRPWMGKYCDEYSKKRLMLLGVLVFLLCPLLYIAVPKVPLWLYGVRVVHGISFALFYTASASLIGDIIPDGKKGQGISLYSAVIKLAMAFAPGLGLFLVRHGEVDYAFLLASGLAFLAFLMVVFFRDFLISDVPGAEPAYRRKGKWINRQAIVPGIIMASNSMVFGALIPFIPLLAQEKQLTLVGPAYTVYAILLIGSRLFIGQLSDSRGRDTVVLPAMALVFLSLLGLSLAPGNVMFMVMMGLYGLAGGSVQPALIAMVLDRGKMEERGSTMATFTSLSDLGIALGSLLMGWLGAQFGYSITFFGVVLLGSAGWFLFLSYRHKLVPGPVDGNSVFHSAALLPDKRFIQPS